MAVTMAAGASGGLFGAIQCSLSAKNGESAAALIEEPKQLRMYQSLMVAAEVEVWVHTVHT